MCASQVEFVEMSSSQQKYTLRRRLLKYSNLSSLVLECPVGSQHGALETPGQVIYLHAIFPSDV
jgi:hypothetical protein